MGLLDFIAPGKKQKESEKNASTQRFLRIGEIKDNILILKNGSARAIIKTSSLNFNLKSEQEQNAIISAYQGFLNSLEFPIQILIKSKKLDLDDYIDQIKELGEKQENKLLKDQTFEYAQYVKRLIDYADIMEKEFYVIVPYDPGRVKGTLKTQTFFQRMSPQDTQVNYGKRKKEFENIKKWLSQRTQIITNGLENCGLKAELLNTTEIIKLFYSSYNPILSRDSKLKDLENTSIERSEEKE